MISCNCEVCTSDNPKDKRTRSSIFIESPTTKILVDTGPDLRAQLLREKITAAHAVVFTHGHADHTVGFDEVRAFCWRREDLLPIHGSEETLEILERMFPWAFNQEKAYQGYVRAEAVPFQNSFTIGDIHITPIPVIHGSVDTHGFRFLLPSGKVLIYIPDAKSIPDLSLLREANLHILDGLRFEPHPTHMHVDEACAIAEQINSPHTYLTHLSHDIGYERDSSSLPPKRHYAYDGLSIML